MAARVMTDASGSRLGVSRARNLSSRFRVRDLASQVAMKAILYPAFCSLVIAMGAGAENWPSWRGDLLGSGVTSETQFPGQWGPKKNLRWRIELPERGNSTPVVHGERVFLTQAVTGESWRGLMCLDRQTGKEVWKRGVIYKPKERTHRANPYCSASPATNGRIVVASYGSAGVVAYDMEGKQLWQRDLGAIDHVWGNSTSPVLFEDLVIHYHGPATNAVLYGLDAGTGETRWEWKETSWEPGKRTDGFQGREDEGVIGSFSTPIVVKVGTGTELIMSFPMELKSFDPRNGKVLWTCSGLNPLVYTSPVYSDGIVVAMGGYKGNSIGVRVGGRGNVTESHRLWQEVRHNGGIGTGVVVGGHHFYHNSGGVVFCDSMKSGETIWKARLPGAGKSWGSFILSGQLIYTLSQAGDTVVFKASPEGLEVVGQSDVDEETNSSLAVSGGNVFLRTHKALWCFAVKPDA
ncbi:MAG: serine/threonine protein kinase [Roseibacillus sp.]|nr:serine/threonine protein kinase [Roseibacillus sp.]